MSDASVSMEKFLERRSIISGKVFKAKVSGDKTFMFYNCNPVKLTYKHNVHNGFEFKEGLNVDKNYLNTNVCSEGGIYITFEHCFERWLKYNDEPMYWIWDVEVPDDALVYLESDTKIKMDKLILSNKRCIWDDENRVIRAVKYNSTLIINVINPSEEVQLELVRKNAFNIGYIENPSEKVQLEAMKAENILVYNHINCPTQKVKNEAANIGGPVYHIFVSPNRGRNLFVLFVLVVSVILSHIYLQ
jgi:hypothetical protein